MHPVCGRLRGKAEPSREICDRIASFSSTWKLHWYPATTPTGDPRWLVADHRAGDEYRAVGEYRLRRFERDRPDLLAHDPLVAYGSELMRDGGYVVCYLREEELGSDRCWKTLTQAQRWMHDQAVPLLDARYSDEWNEVKTEFRNNAEYEQYWHDRVEADPRLKEQRDQLTDEAWEAKDYHLKQKRSFSSAGRPT